MKTKLLAALILGSFVLAGCGGGGSGDSADMKNGTPQVEDPQTPTTDEQDRIAELEEQLADAEERARQAEAARREAEMEAEMEAEEVRQAADARPAFEGLAGATSNTDGAVGVTPKYRAAATVETAPAVTFTGSSLSSSGSWSVTTLSNAGSTHDDDLVVYTDMGAPTRVLITESTHSALFSPVAETNNIRASSLSGNTHPIASSRFPGGGRSTTFVHTIDSDPDADGSDSDGNTRNDYDTTRFSGTFGDAPGTFECTGTCTVEHQGGSIYNLSAGTWTFTTSETSRVSVDDDSYMYFGWWKREERTPGSLSFETFSGGAHEVDDIPDTLTGTATYTGQAAGQYAIYQPAGGESGAGSFTASANLTANFGAADAEGTLSGRVTGFSNDEDWSLTLRSQAIDGGGFGRASDAVTNPTVSWTIGTHTEDGGAWDAQFFSDVDGSTAFPEGVAGTFSAQFGEVGRLVGAFGAHCPAATCPRN